MVKSHIMKPLNCFGFDQWFSADIHTARDIMLMQRMAEYFDLEFRDERKNK